MSYLQFLQEKIKEQHTINHSLSLQLEQQRQSKKKLAFTVSKLRKSESLSKNRIQQLETQVLDLQKELKTYKQPLPKKPLVPKQHLNVKSKDDTKTNSKAIFKEFLNNSFPKYKQTVKKILAFIMWFEKFSTKNCSQRISHYSMSINNGIKKGLSLFLGKKSDQQKNDSIASKLVNTWNASDSKMKEVLKQNANQKITLDKLIDQLKDYEQENTMLLMHKRRGEQKQKMMKKVMQLKGVQFANSLRAMVKKDESISLNQEEQIKKLISVFEGLRSSQSLKVQEVIIPQKEQISEIAETINDEFLFSQQRKFRKTPPVLKKNIYGYYEKPQFQNNKVKLTVIKHPQTTKAIQTTPDDLSIICVRPIILLSVIDGKIIPQRNRHRIDFYVRTLYNEDDFVDTTVKNSLQPVWEQQFLIKDYDFPFMSIHLMNKSKGLRDFSIGQGKIHVAPKLVKFLNVKSIEGQHQGRINLSLSYPRGNFYQFTLTSVKVVKPENERMGADTFSLKFPMNGLWKLEFGIEELIKYVDKSFLILEGCEEGVLGKWKQTKRSGLVHIGHFTKKSENIEVEMNMKNGWKVILCGHSLLLVSDMEEPEQIQDSQIDFRYFSLRAPHPIITVQYDGTILPSHIKMPLVFHFSDENSSIEMKQLNKDKEEQLILMKAVAKDNILQIDNGPNVPKLNTPKKVYKVMIESIEGEVKIKSGQQYYEKLLERIVLICGQKEFSIGSAELLEGYYVFMSRNFKKQGYLKFKIGYIVHENTLRTKSQPVPIYHPQQTLDSKEHYLCVTVLKAKMMNRSSTSSYECKFYTHKTKKIMGNYPHWKQKVIVPYSTPIQYKIVQHGLISEQCIAEGEVSLGQSALRLGLILVDIKIGVLYIGQIITLSEVFELKVEKISGELNDSADWVGSIDPYLKFTSMGKCIYTTQKLQGGGSHPEWLNDHFQTILASPTLSCHAYDEDLINDDYLGECIFSIPTNPCTTISALLQHKKENCGQITLNGQFHPLPISPVDLVIEAPPSLTQVYRITIYKLELNKEFMDDSKGYIKWKKKKSQQFLLSRDMGAISMQFVVWITNPPVSLTFQLHSIKNGLIKDTHRQFGSVSIEIGDRGWVSLEHADILSESSSYIGTLQYILEPIQHITWLPIEHYTTCIQAELVSDVDDWMEVGSSTYLFYYKQFSCINEKYQIKKEGDLLDVMKGNDEVLCRMAGKSIQYIRNKHKIKKKVHRGQNILWHLGDLICQYNNQSYTKQTKITLQWESFVVEFPLLDIPHLQVSSPPTRISINQQNHQQTEQFTNEQSRCWAGAPIRQKGGLFWCQFNHETEQCEHSVLNWLYVSILLSDDMKRTIKYNSDYEGQNFTIDVYLYTKSSCRFKLTQCKRVGYANVYFENIHLLHRDETLFAEIILSNNVKEEEIRRWSNVLISEGEDGFIYPTHFHELQLYAEYERHHQSPTAEQHSPMNNVQMLNINMELELKKDVENVVVRLINILSQCQYCWELDKEGERHVIKGQNVCLSGQGPQWKFHLKVERADRGTVQQFIHGKQIVEGDIVLGNEATSEGQHIFELYDQEGHINGKAMVQYAYIQETTAKVIQLHQIISNKQHQHLTFTLNKDKSTKSVSMEKQQGRYMMKEPMVIMDEGWEMQVTDKNGGIISRMKLPSQKWAHLYQIGTIVKSITVGRTNPCTLQPHQPTPSSCSGIVQVRLGEWEGKAPAGALKLTCTSSMRTINFKPQEMNKLHVVVLAQSSSSVTFNLLSSSNNIIGAATLTMPHYHQHEQLLTFHQGWGEQLPIGVCKCWTHLLDEPCVELQTISAESLLSTELFTSMTPYLEVEQVVSGVGMGKDSLFWKLGLIKRLGTHQEYKITMKDKDMFFDDFIGMTTIPVNPSSFQSTTFTAKCQLMDEEGKQPTANITATFALLQPPSSLTHFTTPTITKHQTFAQISIDTQNIHQLHIYERQNKYLLDRVMLNDWCNVSRVYSRVWGKYEIVCLNKKKQQVRNYTHEQTKEIEQVVRGGMVKKISMCYEQKKLNHCRSVHVYLVSQSWMVCLEGSSLKVQGRSPQILTIQPIPPLGVQAGEPFRIIVADHETGFASMTNLPQIQYHPIVTAPIYRNASIGKQTIGHTYLQLQHVPSQMQLQVPIEKNSRIVLVYVELKRAELTEDIEMFSKMDPYCAMKMGGVAVFRTHVQDNVGMNPVWEEGCYLRMEANTTGIEVQVEVVDQQVTKDRIIGKSTFKLVQLSNDKEYKLEVRKEKKMGDLWVKVYSPITSYIVFTNIKNPNDDSPIALNPHAKHYQLKIQTTRIPPTPIQVGQQYPINMEESLTLHIEHPIKTQQLSQTYPYKQLLQKQAQLSNRIVLVNHLLQLSYMMFI